MTKIQLDKTYYHQLSDMRVWCRVNIGVGHYEPFNTTLPINLPPLISWIMTEQFGNGTFCFAREEDAVLFSLRWL